MKDEFGCEFLDAVFPVYEPETKKANIEQHLEKEKDKILFEYPLRYPEYDLAFVKFIYPEDSIDKTDESSLSAFMLFRAYLVKREKA